MSEWNTEGAHLSTGAKAHDFREAEPPDAGAYYDGRRWQTACGWWVSEKPHPAKKPTDCKRCLRARTKLAAGKWRGRV